MAETAPDLRHLLQDALAEEDRRLDALEAHLSNLHAQRMAQSERAREPEPPPPPPAPAEPAPAEPAPEFAEARRLLAESGTFLRELQSRLEQLEHEPAPEAEAPAPASKAPPPPPAPAAPAPAAKTPTARMPAPKAPTARMHAAPKAPPPLPELPPGSELLAAPLGPSWVDETPTPSGSLSRHDLEAFFGARGGEPAWVQRLLQGQQRVAQALEKLEQVASRTLRALEGWPADPSLVARAEHAERALAEAQLESSARAKRLEALEARLTAPAPAASTGPELGQLVELLRQADQAQTARHLRAALGQGPAKAPRAAPAEGLREELLAMSAEHQALVEAHARLLDRMLTVFEEDA